MSKVKFIQIGSETLQYNDITPEDGDKIEGYKSKLDRTLNDYPGAIIFGTYTEGGEKKQEIWANGTSYSVGGGGGGTVYVGTYQVTSEGKLPETTTGYNAANNLYFFKDEWSTTTDTSGKTIIDTTKCVAIGDKFKEGDIYVEKRNTEAKALESSGYVYSKGRWEALAGSVNAENVWLKDGQQITEVWGLMNTKKSVPVDTLVAINAMTQEELNKAGGYSLKALLDGVLIKEQAGSASAFEAYLPSKPFTASDGGLNCAIINVYTDIGLTTLYNQPLLAGTTVYVKGQYRTATTCNGDEETFDIVPKKITTTYNLRKKSDKSALETTIIAGTVSLHFTNDTEVTKGQCTSTLKIDNTQMEGISNAQPSTATKAKDDADTTLSVYAKYSNATPGTYTFTLDNSNGNTWGRTLYDKNNHEIASSASVTAPKFSYEVEYSNNKKSTWSELKEEDKQKAYFDKSLATSVYTRTATVTATDKSTDVKFYVPTYYGYKGTGYAVDQQSTWTQFINGFTTKTNETVVNYVDDNKSFTYPSDVTKPYAEGSSQGSVYWIVPATWTLTSISNSLTSDENGNFDISANEVISKQLSKFVTLADGSKLDYKIYVYCKQGLGFSSAATVTFNFR